MVNPLSDPIYLITPLVTAAISVSLIILVLYKAPKSFANRLFSLVLLSLGLWGIFTFAMRASPDVEHALYWDRMMIPAGIAMFMFYYHFTCVYTRRTNRKLLRAAYSLLVATFILSATGLVVSHMTLESYGYAPHFYPTMYVIALGGIFLLVSGLVNLIKARRSATQHEYRTRLTYMIIAIMFPFLGGILDLFPNLPPISILGSVLFGLITAIAIMRYHLFDIRIVMRKGLPYLLTSATVASLYIGLLALLNRILGETNVPVWIHVVLLILLAFGLHPLWQRMQYLVDRWFYRQRYDFLKELERFSQEAHDISDIKQLGSSLVKLINRALQTSDIYLLLLSKSGDFTVVASAGENTARLTLKAQSPILQWLQSNRGPLYYQDLDIIPRLQTVTAKERRELEVMELELLIPLKTKKDELVGLLLLGKKLSKEPYSREDEQLISTVASRITIEIENARLYEEARRSEKALQESEKLFRTIVEAAPSFLMIVDAEGTALYVSPNCEEFTGYTQEELLGKVTLWTHEDDRERLKEVFECVLREGLDGGDFEYKAVRKNGELWYASSSWQLLKKDEKGKIKSVVVQTIDITERKRAEEREKELQEELNRSSRLASIGELSAGVAHEINNPLTGILGFSQHLLEESISEEVRRGLGIIHYEAKRAAKVVDNLLTFARRHELKKEYSDINDIVQKTLELRAYELKTSNIEVVTDLAPSLPKIMADFHQIQEVFLNIILNAEQAMTEAKGNGRLSIKTRETKNGIKISFTDDGPGIPAEHHDKLFNPFFTTRGDKDGTGLGLSVCHGIVVEHGGRIYVKSKPGKETTFFVELPLTTAQIGSVKVIQQEPTHGSK